MKIQVTADAAEVHKKSSIIFSAIMAFLTAFGPSLVAGWNAVPDSVKDSLPTGVTQVFATAVFLVIIGLRYTHVSFEKEPPVTIITPGTYNDQRPIP